MNCTTNNDCEGSNVCGHDNRCRTPCDGDGSCCSGHGIAGYCEEGEGVCSSDQDCKGSLKCKKAACGLDSRFDCCTRGMDRTETYSKIDISSGISEVVFGLLTSFNVCRGRVNPWSKVLCALFRNVHSLPYPPSPLWSANFKRKYVLNRSPKD